MPVNRFGVGDVRHLFPRRVCVLVVKGFGEKLFTFPVETSEFSPESFGPVGGGDLAYSSGSTLPSWVGGGAHLLAAVVADCLLSALLLFTWTSRPSPSCARQVENHSDGFVEWCQAEY